MGLPAPFIVNADGAFALKDDACRQGMLNDLQIGAFARRIEIGFRSGAARTVTHRHVHPAKAFLTIAIIIFGQAIARLLRGIEPSLMQRIGKRAIAGRQGAIPTAIAISALFAAFGAFEIGKHIGIAPALCPFLILPPFKIFGIAPHIDQTIDGRRPAQPLAARAMQTAAAQMRLWFTLITPIPPLAVHGVGKCCWHLDENGPI